MCQYWSGRCVSIGVGGVLVLGGVSVLEWVVC